MQIDVQFLRKYSRLKSRVSSLESRDDDNVQKKEEDEIIWFGLTWLGRR